MGRVAVWTGVGFVIFFVSQRPEAAVAVVHAISDLALSLANGFADFTGGLAP